MADDPNARYPLGLPPGSIRGVLSLLIVGMLWLLLLLPEAQKVPVPLNLYFLLTLVLLFLSAHGKSIAARGTNTPSPLYLPGGSLRIIIIGGTLAVLGHIAYHMPERFDRLTPDPSKFESLKVYLAALTGGFTFGYLLRYLPFRNTWGFQAVQAWLSILAMLALVVEIVIQAFINPMLAAKLDTVAWEAIVTSMAACYFGTRT